jgi:glycosyltransferase involved in cell wall biosynthesis
VTAPLVSVLIPVYRAHATLARCIASLHAQTLADWEAVIAVDDADPGYPRILADAGLLDRRIRFVATGGVRTGVAHARNRALAAARGRLVAPLDADDTLDAERLATLAPLALARGAAADNARIVDEADGSLLRHWLEPGPGTFELDPDLLLDDPVPVLPVVDRSLGLAWVEVPICDDVVLNLLLLDRLGSYPVSRRPLRNYRQRPDSECNAPDAVFRAEAGYRRVLSMLEEGSLVLRPDLAERVRASFRRRITLNAAFGRARAKGWVGSYQAFVARLNRCGRGPERSRAARTTAR